MYSFFLGKNLRIRKSWNKICVAISLLILTPCALNAISQEPHHNTAFIDAPGSIDNLLTYSTYSTDSFWNREGKRLPTFNHFRKRSYLLYTEYALNRCNSLSFNGGYSTVEESLNNNSCGLEDIEFGWKHLFSSMKTSAFTAQIMSIIPGGDKKSSIRYGKFGVQFGLLYSHLFFLWHRRAWYDLELAYRYYHGCPSDQIRTSLALGYNLHSYIQLIAASQLFYGLFNGESKCNLNNVIFHPNYRLLKAQIECVIRLLPHTSLALGAYRHIWGQNIGIGGGYYVGLWVDF
jgi:hypothetical protein